MYVQEKYLSICIAAALREILKDLPRVLSRWVARCERFTKDPRWVPFFTILNALSALTRIEKEETFKCSLWVIPRKRTFPFPRSSSFRSSSLPARTMPSTLFEVSVEFRAFYDPWDQVPNCTRTCKFFYFFKIFYLFFFFVISYEVLLIHHITFFTFSHRN